MEKEFLEILNGNQGILHKVCRLYCPDKDEYEDLFQEIVLQLWLSFPKFRRESKVGTWMYKIALNTAISGLRKSKRAFPRNPISEVHANIGVAGETRIDLAYQAELQEAIDSLNRFDKALLLLYLEEKSYKEMAEVLGITETNIGVKLNRIKSKLKDKFNR